MNHVTMCEKTHIKNIAENSPVLVREMNRLFSFF